MSLLQIYIPEHFVAETVPPDAEAHGADGGEGATGCLWVLRDPAGNILRRGEGPLADMPRADGVQVVVPASVVLLAQVRVPGRNRRKILQLLPYAVEEKLMYDPDAIHVAAGSRLAGGETSVAVIDKGWMRRVIGALRNAGQPPRQMRPETLLPEAVTGTWTAVWNGREGFVRTGMAEGLSLNGGSSEEPPLGLLLAVKEAAAKGNAPLKINLRLAEGSGQPDLESWAARLDTAVAVTGAWDWSAAAYGMEPGIDLLQGEFAPAGFESDWPARLRVPLILVGIIVLLQLGGGLADWLLLAYEKRQLDADMQKTFRQAFPEARVIVDAPLQMQRNLAELRHAGGVSDPADFLPLLARAAPVLSQSGSAAIQAMQYENGTLNIDVRLNGSQSSEQMRNRLQMAGVKLEPEKQGTAKSGAATVRLVLKGGR